VLDGAAVAALFTPAENRTPEQAERVAESDAAVAQLKDADVVVIGVPLYNLDVPVQLKSWIDDVCRAGMTFRYTAQGPVGLVTGKKVFVGLARGGLYKDSPLDTQKPYLANILGFLGMTDVTFVHAEGLNISPEAAEKGWAEAREAIAALRL
jgi:FMN-dependent NADH-azoreductase